MLLRFFFIGRNHFWHFVFIHSHHLAPMSSSHHLAPLSSSHHLISLSRSKTLDCSLLLIYAKRLAVVLVEWVAVVNSQACIRWLWWEEVSYLQCEKKMAHRNSKWSNRYTSVSCQIFIHRPSTSALFRCVFSSMFCSPNILNYLHAQNVFKV